MIKRTLTIGLVIASLGTGLAACGGYGDDPAPATAPAAEAPASGGTAVSVQDNTFDPGTIKVKVGDTVEWTNDGGIAHTVTATAGADFDSGSLAPGDTFSFTADKAGTISYVCTFHPGMQGTIEVS
jgi:plastocyanin